jgi:hypothetical protein
MYFHWRIYTAKCLLRNLELSKIGNLKECSKQRQILELSSTTPFKYMVQIWGY